MNWVKTVCFLVLLLFSCTHEKDDRIVKIDKLLTSLHSEKSFNGTVIIAEKGKTLYEKSFGLSNIQAKNSLNSESIFNIASISKTFTALAILQLKEKGLLKLNDNIKKYFPDFPYDEITIENLLTHTSGLYRIQSKLIREKIDQKGFTNEEVLQVYKTVRPKPYFSPGKGYKYANTNYILLGLIVEKVSKVPYNTYINENIFQKAGMTNTFLKKKRVPKELQSNIVSYYRKPKWLSYRMENINTLYDDLAEQRTFENNYGESAIYTTAKDLLKYHNALQEDILLSVSSELEMYKPFKLTNDKDYVINSKSNYPDHSGLSWSVAKDRKNGHIVFHAGGFRGGRNFFIRNITKDQCIIMLTNNDLTNMHTFTAPMRILNNLAYEIDKKSLPKLFSSEYLHNGIGSALKKYNELKNDERYIQFIDWDFEEIGEELMNKKDFLSAIELYKLYTKEYPKDEFSWSLLGDAYYTNHDSINALKNYQKSFSVNPKHQHAKKMIQKLNKN